MSVFTEHLHNAVQIRKQELLDQSRAGIKIVNFVSPYVPLELLEAADLEYLSWEWFITLYGPTQEYATAQVPDQYFPSYWCRNSRSCFVLDVADPKPDIARTIIGYTCDPINKEWEYLERRYPVYYLEVLRRRNESAAAYWHQEIEGLKMYLEGLTGNVITRDDLLVAISREAEIRQRLVALRRTVLEQPDAPVTSADLAELLYLRRCLRQAPFLKLIAQAEACLNGTPRAKHNGAGPVFCLLGPLFLEPVPPTVHQAVLTPRDLIELCASFGVRTIENHWLSLFTVPYAVPTDEPLTWLADRTYQWGMHAAMAPNSEHITKSQELIDQLGARGVIYCNYGGCELFLMESRMIDWLLEPRRIPFLHLQLSGEEQELDNIRIMVESFILSNR